VRKKIIFTDDSLPHHLDNEYFHGYLNSRREEEKKRRSRQRRRGELAVRGLQMG